MKELHDRSLAAGRLATLDWHRERNAFISIDRGLDAEVCRCTFDLNKMRTKSRHLVSEYKQGIGDKDAGIRVSIDDFVFDLPLQRRQRCRLCINKIDYERGNRYSLCLHINHPFYGTKDQP